MGISSTEGPCCLLAAVGEESGGAFRTGVGEWRGCGTFVDTVSCWSFAPRASEIEHARSYPWISSAGRVEVGRCGVVFPTVWEVGAGRGGAWYGKGWFELVAPGVSIVVFRGGDGGRVGRRSGCALYGTGGGAVDSNGGGPIPWGAALTVSCRWCFGRR